MSHSTVLVVLGSDLDPTDEDAVNAALETALEPFDENERVRPYRVYDADRDGEDRTLVGLNYNEKIEMAVVQAGGDARPVHPERDSERSREEHQRLWDAFHAAQAAWSQAAVELLGRDKVIELANRDDGSEPIGWDEKKQDWFYVSTYNPKSKWDWWQLGGRWRGSLKPKPDTSGTQDQTWKKYKTLYGDQPSEGLDAMRLVDVDLGGMEGEHLAAAKAAWAEAEGKSDSDRYFLFGIDKDITFDQFLVQRGQSLRTFAILLDGEWIEKGHMGWWGMVADEKAVEEWDATYAKILASIDPQRVVAVVDVHI